MFEIIVVNNDADERAILENLHTGQAFSLIHSPGNIGFGKANNLAVQSARGQYLLFLNPDSQMIDGDISEALRLLDHSNKSVFGFKLVTPEGKSQPWSSGSRVTLRDIVRNNLGFPKSKRLWKSTTPVSADWVSGAACMISRNFFEALKGFDERFFLYFEDVDLCRRAQQQGGTVVYFPQITVEHASGQSSSSARDQKRYFYASQDLYFRIHRPKWEGRAVKFLRRLTHFY